MFVRNDLLFMKKLEGEGFYDRLVVPHARRFYLMELFHDDNHLGVSKLYDQMRSFYYWPFMKEDIKNFVGTCEGCLRGKDGGTKRAHRQGSWEVSPKPRGRWHMDLIVSKR